MSEFIFFVKMVCLTIAIVLVMQIQVGERTLESHAMGWVQTSAFVQPMNVAAQGAAKMIKDVSEKVHGAIARHQAGKHKKEEKRSSSFRWDHIHNRQEAQKASMAGD
jgi:hypothetical protein